MTSEARPVVLHVITGLNDGGAEAVLYNLIRAADAFEHRVISLMGPGKYGPLIEREGIGIDYVGLSPALPMPWKLSRLGRLVRRARPDVVQTWMYHADFLGGLAAWRAGHRAIVWGLHHSTLDRRGTKWTTRRLVGLNARLSRWLPRRIITCSQKGEAVHRAIGYPAGKMVVVPNGYNTDAFSPDARARAAIRAEFGVAGGQLLLGCVARYNPQKDHPNLIRAFAEVVRARPDARLLLIGPGLTEENGEIVALRAKLGLEESVTLAGPRPDIPAIMNGLDLHVLGSAFGEAFPNVLSEAMACGTPCVATDVGDSAEILGDTGRICPPRDPAALAAAVLEMAPLAGDPAAAEACRSRIVDRFGLDHMAASYQRVWSESLAGTTHEARGERAA